MYYITDMMLGLICIYVSCLNLITARLNLLKKCGLFLFILLSALILDKPLGQLSGLFVIAGILFLLYHWSSHQWLDLSCALFGYLLMVSCNYVYIWVIQLLFRQSLVSLQSIPAISLTLAGIYCFLCYVLTKQFGIWLHKHLKLELLLTDDRLMKTIFFTLFLVTILFIFNITMGDVIGYSYNVVAFNSILFLALFLASASLIWFLYENIRQKLQAKYMLKQYEHLQTYTSELEKLYQSSRQFKHDYINILTTLSGYIDEGNLGALKRYFHQEILPISRTFTKTETQLGKLSQVKILELKSILSSKLIYALEKKISLELEIAEPIEELYMSKMDFCRIMGIFLDNSIEAALKTEKPLIRLCLIKEPDRVVMVLKNTAIPPSRPIQSLARPGVSEKGEGRGIGLFNVRQILQNHPNALWETNYESPCFVQILTIFHKQLLSE
ncbi:MAG: sensor histidine kinase [Hungatella sp.]